MSETCDPRSLGRTSDKIEANIKLPGSRHKVKVKPWGQVKVHGFGTSCTKHHGDLRFAEEQGFLPKGVLPVWKLVRNCIEDRERCGAELQRSNEVLNQVREESSQLVWVRGSVCVFPQDQTEPLWVPERLVRRCKNEAPDPVAPVDVVDDPTSTKDGAEMRDPFGIPEADTSST